MHFIWHIQINVIINIMELDCLGKTVSTTNVDRLFPTFTLFLRLPINPLSPNINIQILQTDLHTFPLRIS